jgi:hypothetical protein
VQPHGRRPHLLDKRGPPPHPLSRQGPSPSPSPPPPRPPTAAETPVVLGRNTTATTRAGSSERKRLAGAPSSRETAALGTTESHAGAMVLKCWMEHDRQQIHEAWPLAEVESNAGGTWRWELELLEQA